MRNHSLRRFWDFSCQSCNGLVHNPSRILDSFFDIPHVSYQGSHIPHLLIELGSPLKNSHSSVMDHLEYRDWDRDLLLRFLRLVQ